MMNSPWYYQGQILEEIPEGHTGFVYCIQNLTNGKFYIGKKKFRFTRKKKRKGKRSISVKTESDWKKYFGSNTELQEDVKKLGEENFKREILYLCKSQGTCNYLEGYEIFVRNALIREDYYNKWVSVKVSKSQIKL